MKDKTNEPFVQSKYIQKYIKENYCRKEIKLRAEEKEKLDLVLKKYNTNLKRYVMSKVCEDLNK